MHLSTMRNHLCAIALPDEATQCSMLIWREFNGLKEQLATETFGLAAREAESKLTCVQNCWRDQSQIMYQYYWNWQRRECTTD